MTNVAPCKKPHVAVEPVEAIGANGRPFTKHQVTCHVPGCLRVVYLASVKTDADDQARYHRAQHRDAVPKMRIERDGLWDIYCHEHGHLRSLPTRREATEKLDQHLVVEHGLVECP